MSLKLIGQILLTCSCILLLMPIVASAEDGQEDGQGTIDWKIDRINESNRNHSNMETELEKRFPELFKTETHQQIESVQNDQEESMNQLKENLFVTDLETSRSIEETKGLLFAEDYEAPQTSSSSSSDPQSSSMTLMMLAGLAFVLSGIAFLVFKRFADQE